MNKLLQFFLPVTILLAAQTTSAQIINPGFETWTNDVLVPTAMHANSGSATTGWWDYNAFNNSLLGGSPISLTRCTDTVHSGNYSVRLQTKAYTQTSWNYFNAWGIPFIGHPYNDTLGILFNGNVNVYNQSNVPGIPFTQMISQFSFYYQYKPNGIDTAVCRVLLVNQRTPVAGAIFKTNVPTGNSGWQLATLNFTYTSSLTPDTMYVLMSSSSLDKSPKVGSVLWIDDISVALPTGINQVLNAEQTIDIYPNPSTGFFNIHSQIGSTENQAIEIYNILGAKVHSLSTIKNGVYEVDLSQQPKGIYFVKAYHNEKIVTRKIIMQ